ncbi:MAG TPA: S41 family peptidase [Gemmataceae bacterium]|nr:S41 family peptidase [Gemmataceae bacterium]
MKQPWGVWRSLGTIVLIGWASCVLPHLQAGWNGLLTPGENQSLRRQAEQWEETGQWIKASDAWQHVLGKNRDLPGAREHYQLCMRRAQQTRRHLDQTYRQQVLGLSLQDSLRIYSDVLSQLQTYYVDTDKSAPPLLFRQGLEELRAALDSEAFCRDYSIRADAAAKHVFQTRLQSTELDSPVRRVQDAQNLAREIALAGQKLLGLKPAVAILEFACGACSALDEYTCYLTPGEFEEINASWKGEVVGVGAELAVAEKKLIIVRITPGSSAEIGGLRPGDRILRIGQKATANMAAAAANDMLKGEAGSKVELEVANGDKRPRVVQLKRELVRAPSVSDPRFLEERSGIGYLRILGFQEATVQELDVAITKLQVAGMKTLILDLRGNPGGLFDVALQVAERFLSSGVIVATHGQYFRYSQTYEAHGMNSLAVPLVVLVDGETASSAEMLASAIKDNQRGTLVGKTTFGKGCIQRIHKLTTAPAGIRMTVAKFYSPRGLDYSGSGVSPNLDVPTSDLPPELEQDAQIQAALDVARSLAMGR